MPWPIHVPPLPRFREDRKVRAPDVPQGIPGEYPEMRVNGKPYTRIDVRNDGSAPMRAWQERLVIPALEMAATLKAATRKDAPARMYHRAVVKRDTTPFTAKDYTSEELDDLAGDLAQRDEKHRLYVGGRLRDALGAATVDSLPSGDLRVTDVYDFNNYNRYDDGATTSGRLRDRPDLWLARRALPSGVRGVPVDITVPAATMAKARRLQVAGGLPK